MPEIWLSLKRSFQSKPQPLEVHNPMENRHQGIAQIIQSGMLECPNIKDFIHGSMGHSDKPRSYGLNSNSSSIEKKNCLCCLCPRRSRDSKGVEGFHRLRRLTTPSRKTHHADCNECNISSNPKVLVQIDSNDPSKLMCQKCDEQLQSTDVVEAHYISKHSVTKLHKEDSSWQIIEKICHKSSVNSQSKARPIESVLKVQNMQKTFACFEEYREMVRINADKLQKKNPRCLADGNELLRFHGTTLACSLGINDTSNLCTLDHCGVCQILRHGFFTNKEFHGTLGVFTTSTSEEALDSIDLYDERPSLRKSVIVCRVIAGRVHFPLKENQEMDGSGFDSLAEEISGHSNIEQLYVLNPRAVLPCFVVIYKF